MSSVQTDARATGNLFLDNLPTEAFDALEPRLSKISLQHGEGIYERDAPMDTVVFPIGSLLSIVYDMSDGDTAEVGIVGREGMSGVGLTLGARTAKLRTMVQISDGAQAMSAGDFRAASEAVPHLQGYTLRYVNAVLTTTSLLLACNSLHPINERCARWLLMAHDRVAGDTFLLTQDFLSQMLGVRRAGVTLAASALQEAGFISYTRGHIEVRNRTGLESAACECYDALDRSWLSIVGYSARKRTVGVTGEAVATPGCDGRITANAD